jgi:Arc/MetJ-type ribon-helix-helix transcriptional regulator
VQSLASTLNKQIQTELERRVWRKKLNDGLYHYFPASMLPTSGSSEEIAVQFSLTVQELKDIDNLVAVNKFKNRSDAIKWLITEGVKANRAYLDKVADTRNQIEHLKKDL